MKLWETGKRRWHRFRAKIGNLALRLRTRHTPEPLPQTNDAALRRRIYWLIRELRHDPLDLRLVANERLDPDDRNHATRRLVFETVAPIRQSDRYAPRVLPGDLLYLLWKNPQEEVDAILRHLGQSGEERVSVYTAGSAYMPPARITTSLADALARHVDLSTTTPAVLRASGLAEVADHNEAEERRHEQYHRIYRRYTARLARGAKDPEPEHPQIEEKRVELASLLPANGNGNDARALIASLGRSYGRQYTMGDWRTLEDGRCRCEITVSQVEKEVTLPDGSSALRDGRSSGYLSSLAPGEIVRGWPLPEVHYFPSTIGREVPVIAVCTGSGISGLLAHLRGARPCGSVWAIYGVRNWKTKHLYGPELASHREAGRLERLDVAVSRPDPGEGPARRVQELLWDLRTDVAKWIEGGAHVFLCGRLSMGRAVRETFVRILVDQGVEQSEEAARERVSEWEQSLRFQASVSGV